jgi:hypothetical protein
MAPPLVYPILDPIASTQQRPMLYCCNSKRTKSNQECQAVTEVTVFLGSSISPGKVPHTGCFSASVGARSELKAVPCRLRNYSSNPRNHEDGLTALVQRRSVACHVLKRAGPAIAWLAPSVRPLGTRGRMPRTGSVIALRTMMGCRWGNGNSCIQELVGHS